MRLTVLCRLSRSACRSVVIGGISLPEPVVSDQTSPFAEDRPPTRAGLAVSVREFATPIFYYWRLAMVALLIPVLLAIGVAAVSKPVYTAQSRLLVLLGDDYVFRRAVGDVGAAQTFDRAQIVHAEMEILGSRELRERTLRSIGVEKVYPGTGSDGAGMERALTNLARDLSIENVPQSNSIEVRLRHSSPQIAADFINTLVRDYISSRREIFQRNDRAAVTRQQSDLSQQLSSLEARLSDLSNRYAIGDYDQELTAVQQQHSLLTAQLATQDQAIANASARVEQLARQIQARPGEIALNTDQARSQEVTALTLALMEVRERRRVAAARFSDGYSLVVELDRQIAELEGQIAAAPSAQTDLVRTGPNPVTQQIETQFATARSELEGLRSARATVVRNLAEARERLSQLVEVGPTYRTLARDRTLTETALSSVMQNAADTRIQDAIAGANVRVIEAAQPPSKGRAGRALILAAGLVTGLLAAATVILVSAATSPIMVTPRDVEERLKVPVLAAAPLMDDTSLAPPEPHWRPHTPRISTEDAAIILRRLEGGGVLAVVGSEASVGVSSIALDLALASALRAGVRTLLIDCEPQHGDEMLTAFRTAGAPLSRLQDKARIVRVGETQLYITSPMARTGSAIPETRWRAFIDEVRTLFPVIILDTPALSRSSSGVLLGAIADSALIVIEAEKSRTAVVAALIQRIQNNGGNVIGAVLNMRWFHIPEFLYRRI